MANETLKRKNSEDLSRLNAKKSPTQDAKVVAKNDSSNNAPSLTNLPNEILGKIMDLLSFDDLFNLESVSKRMQKISLDIAWPRRNTLDEKSINYGINLDNEEEEGEINDKKIELILSRANIKHLDLSYYSHIITHQICFHLEMAPQLIKLNMPSIKLNNQRLKTFARSCPLLEHVSFGSCTHVEMIDDGLEFLFKRCSNIKYLDLSATYLPRECFAHIPKKLRYLNLTDCINTSSAMELLSKNAKDLKTLILHDFEPTNDVNIWLKELTKLQFLQISCIKGNLRSLNFSHLQDLEMLCLCSNNLVTDETLKSLKYCSNLKGLDIGCNEQLNSSALEELKICKSLKYCDFSCLKNLNNELVNFVQTFELEYLAINECSDLSQNVLKSLITECNASLLSLSQLDALGENFNEIFSKILSEKCIHRSNILKLFVEKGKQALPLNDWCEVVLPSSRTYEGIYKEIYESNSSL